MRATAPLYPPERSTLPPAPEEAERAPRRAPRISYRRAFRIGIAASLLLHLLVLLFAWRTRLVPVPATREHAPALAVGGERAAMRVERIVPVAEAPDDAEAPVVPERETEPMREAIPGQDTRPEAVDAAPSPGASAVERLRPRMVDPRLWTRPELPPPEQPSDIERVRARIAQRLKEWNDSVAYEAGRAADALDWTVKDGEGRRWGISPGKIHLGDITVPVPVGLGGPSPRREEEERRARGDAEVAAQAERAKADENREERARAIRERKDRERQDRAGGTTGGAGSSNGNGSGSTGSGDSGSGNGSGSGSGTGASGSGSGAGGGSQGGSTPGDA